MTDPAGSPMTEDTRPPEDRLREVAELTDVALHIIDADSLAEMSEMDWQDLGQTLRNIRAALAASRPAPAEPMADLDADDWESIRLALASLPTWFPETFLKVTAIQERLAASPLSIDTETKHLRKQDGL